MNIKKGDQVRVISGNDRGRFGKVIAVFPHTEKIAVESINVRKKHVRPRKQGQKGEMIQFPAPFSASRAMLVCSQCKKAIRIAYRIDNDKKVRICRKCGALL